jgi:catechol 2,3-dioxygenase-like lactoylglutathione lyase family enzyme
MITAMPRLAIATADFEAIVDTFGRRLGLPVIDLSPDTVPKLGARIAMCVPDGGSHIELMSPAVPQAPLSQSLQRFLGRRGQGLFALMLEAPDPDAEAQAIAARGLRVLPLMAGAGGRDIHPSSTQGVLIRVYPNDSYPGRAPAGWQGLGLSGVQRVVIAVADLPAAAATWGPGLGLPADAPVVDEARGVTSVIVRPPRGGAIELVAVRDAARPFAAAIAAQLAAGREGLHALVLHAADPRALREALLAAGVPALPAPDSPDVLEIRGEAAHGALLRIERRAPG